MFDIFRVLRVYAPKKKLYTAFLDIAFWALATVGLFAFVLTVSAGRMRWYVLFGTFCGSFVYMSALSDIVFKIMLSVVRLIQKLLNLLTRPLYLFLRWGWGIIKKTGRKTEAGIRTGIKKRKQKKGRAGKDGGKKKKEAERFIA